MTPDFKSNLEKYMHLRGIRNKSKAIQMALQELVSILNASNPSNFESWLGAGLHSEIDSSKTFKSEDDLWKKV
jgi:hypothetical protein